jgi:predicted Rossmann fold nucleotide-binding protein DprA/Smf involved in DNA uptake
LIKGGARLCESAGDVLEAIGASRPAGVNQGARPAAGASERSAGEGTPESRLLAVLTRDPLTVDALAHAAGLSVPQTLTALLSLQWAGAVLMLPGQRWARASS